MASGTKWGKISRTRFQQRFRSQKIRKKHKDVLKEIKLLLRRFLSFFDVRDELRHSRSTASIVRRRFRPSRRCRGRSPPRGAPGRGCPWWRRLAGSRCWRRRRGHPRASGWSSCEWGNRTERRERRIKDILFEVKHVTGDEKLWTKVHRRGEI